MRRVSHIRIPAVVACFSIAITGAVAQESRHIDSIAAISLSPGTTRAETGQAVSRESLGRKPTVSSRSTTGTGSIIHLSARENGRLLVPVVVDGKKGCQFLLDTGANTTVISERLATKVGVTARSNERVQIFAGKLSLSAGRIESLEIGNYWIAVSDVLVADLGRLFNLDPEIDGILGEDVLSLFSYLLDRKGRRLEIDEHSSLSPTLVGTRVAFNRHGGKIYVPVAGGNLNLMLDSGNPYLVVYDDAASRLQTVVAQNFRGDKIVGSAVGRRAIRPCMIGELSIGDSVLRNVEAYLSTRGSGRTEDGFLPLYLFDSIYVDNLESFLIANPKRKS